MRRVAASFLVAGVLGVNMAVACDLGGPQLPTPDVRATIQASADFPTPSPTARAARRPFPSMGVFSAFFEGIVVRVVKVEDIDAISVVFDDGATLGVRLLGISVVGTEPSANDSIGARCIAGWGLRAAEEAVNILEGRTVTILLDARGTPRASPGALSVYVQVDGGDFGASLVKQGLATVDKRVEIGLLAAYLKLEEQAKEQGLGLWQCDQ